MEKSLQSILEEVKEKRGNVTVLTGAGISAESGIPTFRGRDGYWTVGSREYHPQEMATLYMFQQHPYEVWQWYLYRKTICAEASPNAAHLAVAALEQVLGDRFCLITQNVDGLHLRAGNSLSRTYQIHGNINFMRCAEECSDVVFPVPAEIPAKTKEATLTAAEKRLLVCPACKAMSRPHVLWFDECYNEHHYRFNSSLQRAAETDVLLVIGTSGATNLPMQVGAEVAHRGAALIDINPEPNPFTQLALSVPKGYYFSGKSSEIVPEIVEFLR